MSIIAVKGIPLRISLPSVVTALKRIIEGNFEALNFQCYKYTKVCYLRLSASLDPLAIVEKINRLRVIRGFKGYKATAFIPNRVPDLPLAVEPKVISRKAKPPLNIPFKAPEKILPLTHGEILIEMQSKFTGLYNLSAKTGHKLLEEIAKIIAERLKKIMDTSTDSIESCTRLSKCYRKTHPHFGDFQLILSTLHGIEDANAETRTQVLEQDLSAIKTVPYVINNIPIPLVQEACKKYSDRITKRISDHIKNLKTEVNEGDSEDELARKKVREALKKLNPHLPLIIKQVIWGHLMPAKTPFYRIRLYGEPHLPPKHLLNPLLHSHEAVHLIRSDLIFNMIRFNVPPEKYESLIAADGTVIGDAKLVIRCSDMPLYVASTFGEQPQALPEEVNQHTEADWVEPW